METHVAARVLVADDDSISLQYLAAALREFGCEVALASNGNAALAACATTQFDLLLLDRCMPDCGGAALLRELRGRGCASIAVATSAELDATLRAELDEAGYADAVTKPLSVDDVAALLVAHVSKLRVPAAHKATPAMEYSSGQALSTWLDDASALTVLGGDMATLRALRGLFASELETGLSGVAAMSPSALGEWLHRLRASCRYCGALRLHDTAQRLETASKNGLEPDEGGLQPFRDAISQTLAALKAN
ncbi:MAG: response regulator [Proteobacteria bacterium]|nr:response regulator [Pseudomonadota bacterium]